MNIDPVTVEIIRNALNAAADDMNATLIRSAYTPIIYECGDCVVALLDAHHQVLGQSAGLPIFLGNLETCTKATEERFGRDVWQPGDVWILNDSYLGGTHLNDVTIFGPVFAGGTLVGFTASRAHWIDVGSKDPGGSMDSVSIFQEGLRLGPQKLVSGGVDEWALMDTIARNVRFPYPTSGDMHAMIACITMGEQRLRELVDRFGLATLEQARDEIFRQTEALERETIAAVPDGVYTAEGVLDNDGIDLDVPVPIRLTITVAGETIDFDVTESGDQTTGPVNCGVAQAVSALRVGYKLLVSPDLPGNGGSFRTMTTRVREGSVLGARPPAACQWYFSHLGLLIDMVARALAPALPERVAGASHGDSMIVLTAGMDPRVGREFVSLEATVGGWGAWSGSDGESALINNVNGSLKDIPVEVFETRYPWRINEYRIPSPRYLYTGAALSQTGGHGDPRGVDMDVCGCNAHGTEVVDGVDALRVAVRDRFRRGAHAIKIMTSGGVMSLADPIRIPQYSAEEIRAVTDEAARRGSYVAAHAYSPEAIRHSVENGVRSIEHGNLLDPETAALMAEHGAFLVPTLAAYDAIDRRAEELGVAQVSRNKNREVLHAGAKAVELARAAGVPIGFGTDLMGALEDDQLHGLRLQVEVEGPLNTLRSATSVNADLLGRPDLGRVRIRAAADFLIVDGDPFTDPSVLWGSPACRTVIQAGVPVND